MRTDTHKRNQRQSRKETQRNNNNSVQKHNVQYNNNDTVSLKHNNKNDRLKQKEDKKTKNSQ